MDAGVDVARQSRRDLPGSSFGSPWASTTRPFENSWVTAGLAATVVAPALRRRGEPGLPGAAEAQSDAPAGARRLGPGDGTHRRRLATAETPAQSAAGRTPRQWHTTARTPQRSRRARRGISRPHLFPESRRRAGDRNSSVLQTAPSAPTDPPPAGPSRAVGAAAFHTGISGTPSRWRCRSEPSHFGLTPRRWDGGDSARSRVRGGRGARTPHDWPA